MCKYDKLINEMFQSLQHKNKIYKLMKNQPKWIPEFKNIKIHDKNLRFSDGTIESVEKSQDIKKNDIALYKSSLTYKKWLKKNEYFKVAHFVKYNEMHELGEINETESDTKNETKKRNKSNLYYDLFSVSFEI